jgi:hypothetical protein
MLPLGAKWNLRPSHRRLVAVIAAAMLGMRARGLVATQAELGQTLGVSARWVRELVTDLTAWGLLASEPTFVAYGKVHSQRANVYRLTTLAACVWRLVVPPGVGPLPAPVLGDRARAPARKKDPPIQKLSSGEILPEAANVPSGEPPPAESAEAELSGIRIGELVDEVVEQGSTPHISTPSERFELERRQAELAEQVRQREQERARRPVATPGLPSGELLEHVRTERDQQRTVRTNRPTAAPIEDRSLDDVIGEAWSSWTSRRGGSS